MADLAIPDTIKKWAVSSVGRALHSHCRGQRFESATVHQTIFNVSFLFILQNEWLIWRICAVFGEVSEKVTIIIHIKNEGNTPCKIEVNNNGGRYGNV